MAHHKTTRRPTRSFHRWCGLWAGLWLAFTGATGTLLVIAPSLEGALHPNLYRVRPGGSRLPLDQLRDAVGRAYPLRSLARVELPLQSDEAVRFFLDSTRGTLVLVDPYTGRVLGERELSHTLGGFVRPWHVALLPGADGDKLNALVALTAISLAATGWTLARPGRAALRRGPSARPYDIHRWLGWGTAPWLVLAACSGGALIFYGPLYRWLGAPTVPQLNATVDTSLDAMTAAAEAALPGSEVRRIQFSENDKTVVRLRRAGEPNPNGANFATFVSGQLVSIEDSRQVGLAGWALQGAYRVHTGQLNDATRAGLAFLGLTPGALWISGLAMRRRRAA